MSAGSQRIDKWLWCARFLKSRSCAARLVEDGLIRLGRNGETVRVDKPATLVKVGDTLAFVLGDRLVMVRIDGVAGRRGSAAVAAGLFTRLAEQPGKTDHDAPCLPRSPT